MCPRLPTRNGPGSLGSANSRIFSESDNPTKPTTCFNNVEEMDSFPRGQQQRRIYITVKPFPPPRPPGSLLKYAISTNTIEKNSGVQESLQSKCVKLLGTYIQEYLEAMGKVELHRTLSLLPPETLSTLSIVVSTTVGMNNDLAYILGRHAHVHELSFRAATNGDNTLTDEGLWELVPNDFSSFHPNVVYEDWEDACSDKDENTATDEIFSSVTQQSFGDVVQMEGCNIRLQRLELIDCLFISAHAVLALLENCSCLTHLSLAGSIQVVQDGVRVMERLPELLPALQVLDVTGCGWMTTSLAVRCQRCYHEKYDDRTPPNIYYQGAILPHDYHLDAISPQALDPDW